MNEIDKAVASIAMAFDGVFDQIATKFIKCLKSNNLKKSRLPRKLKKKYKKLGIYEDWKKIV